MGKCPELADDPSYPRFIICVVQFEKQLKAQNLTTIMRDYQHSKAKEGGKKMGIKGFHYRMAEEKDALELSGYDYNAITPFFMNGGGEKLPIILAQDIAELDPAYLWFSGGRIQIKMGVSVPDFVEYFKERVTIANIY